jgi:hypothetical protein
MGAGFAAVKPIIQHVAMPNQPEEQFSSESSQAIESADRWLALFAPMLDFDQASTAKELERRIKLLRQLRSSSPDVQRALSTNSLGDSAERLDVIVKASAQLASIEDEYQRRLAIEQPGNALSLPNLDVLKDKLAEHAARIEVGAENSTPFTGKLEMQTARGSIAAASGLGVFALGWLSFTTLHACLMIGGMLRSIGWGALALLAFYAIFYFAGFAMAFGAFISGSNETMVLDGTKLRLTRKLGPIRMSREYTLDLTQRAKLGTAQLGTGNSRTGSPVVQLVAADGKTINIGAGSSREQLQVIQQQLNGYIVGAVRALG